MEINPNDLFAELGRLHMEVMVLRSQLAASRQQLLKAAAPAPGITPETPGTPGAGDEPVIAKIQPADEDEN